MTNGIGVFIAHLSKYVLVVVASALAAGALALVLAWPANAQSPQDSPPAKPQGLTGVVSHDSVSLTWDDPGDDSITGYQVLRRNPQVQAKGEFVTVEDDTESASTSYVDATVEPQTRYFYRVKARNANGLSEESGFFKADTPAAPTPTPTPAPTPVAGVPAAPTGLTVTSVSHNSVALSWDDPADSTITGYQVLRRNPSVDDKGVFTTVEDDTGTASASYTDTTVSPQTRYFYRVKARNANGLSAQSGFVRAEAPAPGPVNLGDITHSSSARWVDGSQQGEVGATDRYRFQLTATQTVELKLLSQDANADLILLDELDAVVVESRNDGAANEEISKRIPPGVYTAAVEAQEATANQYRLTYEAILNSEPHHFGNITDVQWDPERGANVASYVGVAHNRIDYYSFTLTRTRNVHLLLTDQQGDTDLTLEDEDGAHIANSQNSGTDDDVITTSLDAGTWYIAVIPKETGTDLSYRLRFGVIDSTDQTTPALEFPTKKVLSAGWLHTCALDTEASVVCWGYNHHGQLDVPEGAVYSEISLGRWSACGLLPDGHAQCWGSLSLNHSGSAFTSVSVGGVHACGIRSDNEVRCWGENRWGSTNVPNGMAFSDVDAGEDFTCGIKTDGTLACWGTNTRGESSPPTGHFTSVSLGEKLACGIETDGTLTCWGENTYGQADPPAGAFAAVSAGHSYACGIRTDGALECWGQNRPDLYTSNPPLPEGDFVALSVGKSHGCAVTVDGKVECWGFIQGTSAHNPEPFPMTYPPDDLVVLLEDTAAPSYDTNRIDKTESKTTDASTNP